MKDYKSRKEYRGRSPAKGKKSGLKDQSARRGPGKVSLPKGFQHLVVPAPAREPGSRLASSLPEIGIPRRWHILRAAFVLILAWLLLGLFSGAVALWNSPLEEVILSGNSGLSSEEVLRLGGLAAGTGMNELDPYRLARRIRGHPLVRSADVRRIYPGRLEIRIRERTPDLRVRLAGGNLAVVDAENVVLSIGPGEAADKRNGGELSTLIGVQAPALVGAPLSGRALERGREALRALEKAGFSQPGRLAVDLGSPFYLEVRMPGGQRLRIPYGKVGQALEAYRTIVERSPELFRGVALVDFAPMDDGGGGRIILSRNRSP